MISYILRTAPFALERMTVVIGLAALVLAVSVGLAGDALAGSPWVTKP